MSFTKLCHDLNVNAQEKSQKSLNRLIDFCKEQIGQDTIKQDMTQEQFNYYYDLVKLFVEKVLPNIDRNQVHHPIDSFNHMSSLEFLVRNGYDQQIKLLQLNKEDVNVAWGLMSPLHVSLSEGYFHTTEALLKFGAKPCLKNDKGETAFDCVLELPISYDESLKKAKQQLFLNLSTADPNLLKQRLSDNSTVLQTIAIFGYPELASNILNSYPEYVLIANKQGNMPIHTSILNRQFNVAKLILKAGPVEQMLDLNRQGPLHYAAIMGDVEFVDLCHFYTNNIDLQDKDGRTALMLAAYYGHLDAMAYLIQSSASLIIRDKYGLSVFDICIKQDNLEEAEYLLKVLKESGNARLLSEEQQEALGDLRRRAAVLNISN